MLRQIPQFRVGSLISSAKVEARAGEVALFATGQGRTVPTSRTGAAPGDVFPEPALPVTLRIGGREAEVLFRGQAPGTVGVMQINARVPEGLAGDAVPVVLGVGPAESQAGVTVAVR